MPGIFDEYKIALLDSSFFVSDFSEDVRNGLRSIKVYVANTFNSEIEQYRTVLSAKRQCVYDANVRFLTENMRLNTLDLGSFGAKSEGLQNDMWGLICLLADLRAKFVVITANQVLIQKIVLKELCSDIYDLNGNRFIRCAAFSAFRSGFKFTEAVWTTPPMDRKVAEGTTLFCKTGSGVTLEKELKSGLEASLYLVKGKPAFIAKIFKKDRLSAGKYQNIKRLSGIGQTLDIAWAVFPEDILYSDPGCTSPVGFLEAYVRTGENLDENPLFLGDPFNVTAESLAKRQSYAVDLCLKIVRQVCYLNIYGFYISDFNMGNFAELQNDDAHIQMWDTDSFGYESFFGRFFSPNYVEGSSHPPYDTGTKGGAIDISNDALYQFVFSVLSLGDAPFSERTRSFKYDNPEYFAISRKTFFPRSIWNHLEEVFRGVKTPSAEALMKELIVTKDLLLQNPAGDKTFYQLFIETIPGYEDALIELETAQQAQSAEVEQTQSAPDILPADPGSQSVSGSSSTSGGTSAAGSGKKKTKKKAFPVLLSILAVLVIAGYLISTEFPESIDKVTGRAAALQRASEDSYLTPEAVYTPPEQIDTAPAALFEASEEQESPEFSSEPVVEARFHGADHIGWTEADAAADIIAAGWNVNYEYAESCTVKQGVVIYESVYDADRIVTLGVSVCPAAPEDLMPTGAILTVSESDVYLSTGQSVTLYVSASGACPESYYFNCQTYTSIQGVWGLWTDPYTAEITFAAGSIDETGYVRFTIVDSATDQVVGYTDIFITVQ